MKFQAKIFGENVTSIKVPTEVIEQLGAGKKPLVVVTLNNYTYKITITNMDGASWIVLNKENRKNAGVEGGQELEVEITLDLEPKTVELPSAFIAALSNNETAKLKFAALTYSKQKNMVLQITTAKTEETKSKRIEKIIDELTTI